LSVKFFEDCAMKDSKLHRFSCSQTVALTWLVCQVLFFPSAAVPHDRLPIPEHIKDDLSVQSIDAPLPRSGNQHMLVIMVDFSDEPGLYRQSSFQNQFFGAWTAGSFADYYSEVSYGALQYTGDVVGIAGGSAEKNSDSIAYVRLPNPKSYYAAGNMGKNVTDFPRTIPGVFYHAVQELEAVNFDFSPYADNSGNITNVIVVFAGPSGVDSGSNDDFMPTAYRLAYYFPGADGYINADGYHFDNFTFCPEETADLLQAPIGVCAHEHGHALGMVDLYDFSYETSGVGFFDTMAYGWSDTAPFHFGAYSKEFFGWVDPVVLKPGKYKVKLKAIETYPHMLKLYPKNGTTSEYFLIVNRQAVGFNSGMSNYNLCPGVYIWHVDETVLNSYWDTNRINSQASAGGGSHPGVALVEADGNDGLTSAPLGYGECSDAWKKKKLWNRKRAANSRLWDGSNSGLVMKVLSIRKGTATLRVTVPKGAAKPAATPKPANGPFVKKIRKKKRSKK
jgi:M6 family metalloprotease-like protein